MNIKAYILPTAAIAFGVTWVVSQTGGTEDLSMSNVIQSDWCMDSEPNNSRGWYCEVREFDMSPGDFHGIDAGPNGGVEVTGWSRNAVRVLAKVQGFARHDDIAEDLVSEVRIEADGRSLVADGPRTQRRESWSVDYRISVPERYDVDVRTVNGGIRIDGVRGQISFGATNGGVSLVDVGGDVSGRTTNGGLKIELSGNQWDGEGLDVRTTNGGIQFIIPDEFNAQLESGTTNGGLSVDFPITVSGRIDNRLITQLGSGGPTIRAITTNGGVTIKKR